RGAHSAIVIHDRRTFSSLFESSAAFCLNERKRQLKRQKNRTYVRTTVALMRLGGTSVEWPVVRGEGRGRGRTAEGGGTRGRGLRRWAMWRASMRLIK